MDMLAQEERSKGDGTIPRVVLSSIFSGLVVLQVLAALASAFASQGFFAATGSDLFRCRELLSSGNDGEVLMALALILAPSAIARAWHRQRPPGAAEVAYYLMGSTAVVVIVVAGSDCGQVWATLIGAKEPYAIAFAVFGLLAIGVLGALCRPAGRLQA